MFAIPMGGFNPSFHPKLYEMEYYMGMGETAEKLAQELDITRDEQEEFAVRSHAGPSRPGKKGSSPTRSYRYETAIKRSTRTKAHGNRTWRRCAPSSPPSWQGGTITAATSSPISIGAAALVVCSEEFANEHGLQIRARIVSRAVAGVDWTRMGMGPIPASEMALERAGLDADAIDFIELNEAFAAQSLYVIKKTGWPMDKINVHGGAIALGHPLGCIGCAYPGDPAQRLGAQRRREGPGHHVHWNGSGNRHGDREGVAMAEIKTIGVCGAGVMGSQLAALFAGAGFDALLFDMNQELSEKGIETALKSRPPAFYDKRFAKRITPCNYDEHEDRVGECDWIIEVIAERLDWKQSLYERIQPKLRPDAVLSSNTSGLSLKELAEGLDEDVQRRFLITHFFNPPRYMRLVEIIPGATTTDDVLEKMVKFVGETLGKGVVYAKDTPNFIANRIGIYGMMLALKLTGEMQLTVEQVDAITGPVMGRPKSATYRTADLVGLDTMAFVAKTAYDKCTADEDRDLFRIPPLLETLLERKSLGQKTGSGFYKKEGKQILALDFGSMDYRPSQKARMDGIGCGTTLHRPQGEDSRPGVQPGSRRRASPGS